MSQTPLPPDDTPEGLLNALLRALNEIADRHLEIIARERAEGDGKAAEPKPGRD